MKRSTKVPSSLHRNLNSRQAQLCGAGWSPNRRWCPNGFSLVESLVGTLLTSLFMMFGIQTFVSAIAIKARAKQITEAHNWVQAELESVKQQASDPRMIPFTSSPLAMDANSATVSITVDSAIGYEVGDALLVGNDGEDNVIRAIVGNTLMLASPLGSDQGKSARVIARCHADQPTGGFAAFLNNKLQPLSSEINNSATPNQGIKTIAGTPYTLTRTVSVRNALPYAVSELNYRVTSPTGVEVANVNTEVVPNASFQCP
jgi:type II secretory pathway pseudopilin PulG